MDFKCKLSKKKMYLLEEKISQKYRTTKEDSLKVEQEILKIFKITKEDLLQIENKMFQRIGIPKEVFVMEQQMLERNGFFRKRDIYLEVIRNEISPKTALTLLFIYLLLITTLAIIGLVQYPY